MRRTLRFAGTIEDDDSRHSFLSAYVAGRIDRLFVNYQGAEVKEGQPLAQLYSPMLAGGFFFGVVERRGYRGYGGPNAPFRIAAQKRATGRTAAD